MQVVCDLSFFENFLDLSTYKFLQTNVQRSFNPIFFGALFGMKAGQKEKTICQLLEFYTCMYLFLPPVHQCSGTVYNFDRTFSFFITSSLGRDVFVRARGRRLDSVIGGRRRRS